MCLLSTWLHWLNIISRAIVKSSTNAKHVSKISTSQEWKVKLRNLQHTTSYTIFTPKALLVSFHWHMYYKESFEVCMLTIFKSLYPLLINVLNYMCPLSSQGKCLFRFMTKPLKDLYFDGSLLFIDYCSQQNMSFENIDFKRFMVAGLM